MSAVPEADRAVGMWAYATRGPPCRALAKASAEDFRVEEVAPDLQLAKEWRPGTFPLYRVEKRSIDTLHMERSLADALKSRVSYGGMKDKRAVAVQYVTPTSTRSLRPEKVVRERFTAELVGFVPRPLSRGMVRGNRFTVVLKDCCTEVGSRVSEAFALATQCRMPNFYGFQRFGAREAGTHEIGRALVRQDFQEAVRTMLLRPRASDDEATVGAREAMEEGRFEEGASMLPPHQDMERAVARRLASAPGDWAEALRAVPLRVRRLYVQAYQSYLFNRTLSLALERGLDISVYSKGDNWGRPSGDGLSVAKVGGVRDPPPEPAVPMVQVVGYAYRNYGSRFDSCVEQVIREEGVAAREFYVKEMQEVSAEGGFRMAHMAVADANFECSGATAELRFTLGRGEYATVLLREIVKPADPAASGLA